MKESTQKAMVAGVSTAAFALFAVGHVIALDWVGRKLRAFVQSN